MGGARRQRVGVLHHVDGVGTCLVPALVLARTGTAVTVLLQDGDAFTTKTTLDEYAQPPTLPDTVAAWQQPWQRLETAADHR